jgi:cell division protein FtsA
MGKNNIIAGLEIARSKLRMVTNELREGEFVFLDASEVDCSDGIRNGTIINLDGIIEAIVKLVEIVAQKTNKKISSAFVNISGLNIKQEVVNSVITLPQRGCEITKRHISDLIESCKIISIPLDRNLQYLLPLEYIIDGQDGIREPAGLCGSRLESKVLIITSPFNQAQNITKALNCAGLEVDGVVLSILANASSLLSEEEKQCGVSLIDFKTDFTEMAVFKDGSLQFFETLPKGYGQVTDEIAARLGVPFELAEEFKIRYGFLDNSGQDERNRDTIPLDWMGMKQSISRGDLNGIISEQGGALFESVLGRLKNLKNVNNILKKGAVITGGPVYMEGLLEWVAQKLGFSVRIGGMEQTAGSIGGNYSVASGLVRFGIGEQQKNRPGGNKGFLRKVYQKADELLTEYF